MEESVSVRTQTSALIFSICRRNSPDCRECLFIGRSRFQVAMRSIWFPFPRTKQTLSKLVAVPTALKRLKIVGRTHARDRFERKFGTCRVRPNAGPHTRDVSLLALRRVHASASRQLGQWLRLVGRGVCVVGSDVSTRSSGDLPCMVDSPFHPFHPFTPVAQTLTCAFACVCACCVCIYG